MSCLSWKDISKTSCRCLFADWVRNSQTRSNNSSAICWRIVWVCLTIFGDWRLKGRKKLIWCTKNPNVYIHAFRNHWSFSWRCFFPLSILNTLIESLAKSRRLFCKCYVRSVLGWFFGYFTFFFPWLLFNYFKNGRYTLNWYFRRWERRQNVSTCVNLNCEFR